MTTRTFLSLPALAALGCLVLAPGPVPAQPAIKGESEYLVPPGGGAADIPVHAGEVCILSFPETLASSALSSSPDYEIKAWGPAAVAVRANGKTPTATLALATVSGIIKINVTLRVVGPAQEALALVRFKPASSEEAFQSRLTAEMAKRMAPLEAELARSKKNLDEQIRDRADGLIAERLLQRNEITTLQAHERNNDNVIVHVERALLLGDDGYVFFQIENRSGGPFRLASVTVKADGKAMAGPARLHSTAIDKDPSIIGVVPAGASARGVVVVRSADQVLGRSLALELAGPEGKGAIRLTRGIALK